MILTATDLAKTYRGRAGRADVAALRGVDLAVAKGEWLAVTGPSGCGKSTLLHLLGGLDTPDRGSVLLGGIELSALREAARAVVRRRRVGVVFQFFNLVSNLTAAENVELPALLAGGSRRDARRRRDELLSALGLADCARAVPGELSGGQQQRLAIARALINRPDVLLADEPTGNLDSATTNDVLDVLRRQRAAGQAIVLVTHDPRVAAAADRVVRMRDGVIEEDMPLAAQAAEAAAARPARPLLADLVGLVAVEAE